MGAQALLWFGIAGGAIVFSLSLLHARYIRRDPRAVKSGGSFGLFALLMLLFAAGAVAAGFVAARAGR